MCERDLLPPGCRARLCLDYGVDEQMCDSGLTITERGMKFNARWHFEIGTQLAVACLLDHPRLGCSRLRLEGIVVWSERVDDPELPQATFETTVLFLELPDQLKQSFREFSYRLETAG